MQKKSGLGKNKNAAILVFSTLALLIIAVLYFTLTGKSHYEKGDEYLTQGKYNEALVEFQKVDSDNKDYELSRSKMNYISGLFAYNLNSKKEAIIYLSKVQPIDPNYSAAQSMLENINLAVTTQTDLEELNKSVEKVKDTIIIKETSEKTEKTADKQIAQKYISGAENLINKFESVYQSAKAADVNNKHDYLNSMNEVYETFTNLQYNPPEKNSQVVELGHLIGEWMQKRMNFIDKLIIDKSVSETNSSRPMLQEGDRAYNSMRSQLNKLKNYYSI